MATPVDARPFLKWAGGKRQLLPELRRFYPERFGRYIEPFVGSGAVFLDLHNQGRLEGRSVLLADSNRDVIGCYQAVRAGADEVIEALRDLEAGHRRGGSAHFYEVRDARFNPLRRTVLAPGWRAEYPAVLAAMLIYLNRTGYNGLYRLNARGEFNVPAGRYDAPRICDADNLRRVAAALRRPRLRLQAGTFDRVLSRARPGDFIYIDPPYAPLSSTARFTAYTAAGFGPEDQVRLRDLVVDLARRGCDVLLSNSTAEEIRELYVDDRRARAAGLRAHEVPARRAINARASMRGPVMEYLITNVPPAGRARSRRPL
jgi:DNA adenine methylase